MGKPQKTMDRSASLACPIAMSNTYHLIDTTPTTAQTAAPTEAVNPINHLTLRAYAGQPCGSHTYAPICEVSVDDGPGWRDDVGCTTGGGM